MIHYYPIDFHNQNCSNSGRFKKLNGLMEFRSSSLQSTDASTESLDMIALLVKSMIESAFKKTSMIGSFAFKRSAIFQSFKSQKYLRIL
mmetsp:Transcript_19056/g.26194  ORF Transcript_19056/g.26194 Transcript_19056/m.26194 type:complete len:89 (+) Transcript_19056:250-516(+)